MPFNVTPPPQPNFTTTNFPVLQKVSQAFKTWHDALPRIPRYSRYSLGEKINNLFIEVAELILAAGFSAKENKAAIVHRASIKLDTLKFFLQLAWELKALDNKNFTNMSAPLVEAGKMLGGWQRQLKEIPPS